MSNLQLSVFSVVFVLEQPSMLTRLARNQPESDAEGSVRQNPQLTKITRSLSFAYHNMDPVLTSSFTAQMVSTSKFIIIIL